MDQAELIGEQLKVNHIAENRGLNDELNSLGNEQNYPPEPQSKVLKKLERAEAITGEKEVKAKEMLEKQNNPAKAPSEFNKERYVREAAKSWNLFYKRNTTNFFKDRHWTEREFPELGKVGKDRKLLEIGCGVGNFVFPLLKANPELFIYCCDFSPKAIELVQQNSEYDPTRCKAFVCDMTTRDLLNEIEPNSIDLLSSIFCLSAVPPQKIDVCMENIAKVLKPGGIFMFRDYGLYDASQLRFKSENKIDERFYVRGDGTFTLFFTPAYLQAICEKVGLEMIENDYVLKEVINRKKELSMDRIFVQGRFRKI
ncbi:Methyltransferase-like protein 6 [Boothiomyces sp. JEL0838]|nr:Methyltransferase-like protein 6 [Boothiomyces sp. JEL0838]